MSGSRYFQPFAADTGMGFTGNFYPTEGLLQPNFPKHGSLNTVPLLEGL
jgi:hypothetical protein